MKFSEEKNYSASVGRYPRENRYEGRDYPLLQCHAYRSYAWVSGSIGSCAFVLCCFLCAWLFIFVWLLFVVWLLFKHTYLYTHTHTFPFFSKPTKVKRQWDADGNKVRVSKLSLQFIPKPDPLARRKPRNMSKLLS